MASLARLVLALALPVGTRAAVVCSLSGGCFERQAVDLASHAHVDVNSSHSAAGKQLPPSPFFTSTFMPTWKGTASSGPGAITVPAILMWTGVVIALLTGVGFSQKLKGFGEADMPLDKYLAEFVGTYVLVFSYGCNTIVGDETWRMTSIACTLMVLLYAFGRVSDAHFNPAVSLAMGLSEKLPGSKVILYMCIQFAAGIAGALSYGLLFGETFNLIPLPGHRWWQAGLAELLYTFLVCFVFLNTMALKTGRQKEFYGLAVGFSVIAGGYAAGGVSLGCFNPAIAFGIDSSSSSLGPGLFGVYFICEMLGAVLAALLFRVCRPQEFTEVDSQDTGEAVSSTAPGEAADSSDQKDPAEAASEAMGDDVKSRVALVSEFIGTYIVVLTMGLNVLSKSKAPEFSVAAALTCMVFALISCSGTHFNPAVTLAVFCSGREKISVADTVYYIVVQLVAAVCAAVSFMLLMNGEAVPPIPAEGVSTKALIGELVFTFMLCFVFLSVATTEKGLAQYSGLAIGGCVVAGGFAIGSLSGGILNPAVSFGLAFSDFVKGGGVEHLFSLAVVQFLGGGAASLVFFSTHAAEFASRD
jgi:aquaporin Z